MLLVEPIRVSSFQDGTQREGPFKTGALPAPDTVGQAAKQRQPQCPISDHFPKNFFFVVVPESGLDEPQNPNMLALARRNSLKKRIEDSGAPKTQHHVWKATHLELHSFQLQGDMLPPEQAGGRNTSQQMTDI